jgi:hypothetical protein
MQHFTTLFDRNFLPQGLALLASLRRHTTAPFRLWVLCLDRETHTILTALHQPEVELLILDQCETPALRAARDNRSYGEYCWTLASHVFSFVFERAEQVQRVTYLDADVYCLADPLACLRELDASGKSVLITEHAFAPQWSHYSRTTGTYCVQYVTFNRTAPALSLLARWQEQTRAQCSSDPGKGGFGDQVYLDEWPYIHNAFVHVLDHRYRTLAPWNTDFALGRPHSEPPIFFHFHGLRILGRRWVLWAAGYPLANSCTRAIYEQYLSELRTALATIGEVAPLYDVRQAPTSMVGWLKLLRSIAVNRAVLHREPVC